MRESLSMMYPPGTRLGLNWTPRSLTEDIDGRQVDTGPRLDFYQLSEDKLVREDDMVPFLGFSLYVPLHTVNVITGKTMTLRIYKVGEEQWQFLGLDGLNIAGHAPDASSPR